MRIVDNEDEQGIYEKIFDEYKYKYDLRCTFLTLEKLDDLIQFMKVIQHSEHESEQFDQLKDEIVAIMKSMTQILNSYLHKPRLFKLVQSFFYNLNIHFFIVQVLSFKQKRNMKIFQLKEEILRYFTLFIHQNKGTGCKFRNRAYVPELY